MFFIPTSPRCSFVIHALGQSPLTIFLLFSALCFLVSSYTIDNSCRNFRGYDISRYIQQAINEVQDMATYAFTGSFTENESAKHLMNSLFGTDPRRHAIVHGYFARFSVIHPDEDFYVMCDDQQVLWAPRDIYNIPPDPMGVWRDTVHSWTAQNSHFTPCDSSRKFGVSEKISLSYSMNRRYIYLCPILFDKPQGLSLAFYKDRDHLGECIDKFMILPVVLFHELLMMYTGNLYDVQVRSLPPIGAFGDANVNVFDLDYVRSFPMVSAFGFLQCHKLALDSPEESVLNANSVALCALGLYLNKNDWGVPGSEGIGSPIS